MPIKVIDQPQQHHTTPKAALEQYALQAPNQRAGITTFKPSVLHSLPLERRRDHRSRPRHPAHRARPHHLKNVDGRTRKASLPEPITSPDRLARLHIHRRDGFGGRLHECEYARLTSTDVILGSYRAADGHDGHPLPGSPVHTPASPEVRRGPPHRSRAGRQSSFPARPDGYDVGMVGVVRDEFRRRSCEKGFEVVLAGIGQLRAHFWLAPPLQVQICSGVPLAVPWAVASRHLPDPTPTTVPSVLRFHCWLVPPWQS